MTLGEHAYLIRATYYFGWEAIAILTGASTPESANEAAKQYAQKKDEAWPVPDPWSGFALTLSKGGMKDKQIAHTLRMAPIEVKLRAKGEGLALSKGKRAFGKACFAYEARALTGLPWSATAKAFGIPVKSVRKQTNEYATTHNLPWPPKMEDPSPYFDKRAKGRLCYEARTNWHWPWAKIRNTLGYRGNSGVFTAAATHAKRFNLPWPIDIPVEYEEALDKMARAYQLRQKGLGWKAVAKLVGYKNGPVASKTVRGYARLKNLPWPIEVLR